MTVHVNPRPRPVRLILVGESEQVAPAWGMVRLEQAVVRAEVVNAEGAGPAELERPGQKSGA